LQSAPGCLQRGTHPTAQDFGLRESGDSHFSPSARGIASPYTPASGTQCASLYDSPLP